jgi:hypothetical protein
MTAPRVPPTTINSAVGCDSEPRCPPSRIWPPTDRQQPDQQADDAQPIHGGRFSSAVRRSLEEARTQPHHRLTVQLTDARLGDPHDLADLAQVEILLVVERHHQLLALRQEFDRLHQSLAKIRLLEE